MAKRPVAYARLTEPPTRGIEHQENDKQAQRNEHRECDDCGGGFGDWTIEHFPFS